MMVQKVDFNILRLLGCNLSFLFVFNLQVLCASSKDHTVVEPLIAPDGAKVGECITFSG